MDADFKMFAATNEKIFQEIFGFRELRKTERNLRGSYKLIGNCERKFKAEDDKNTILRKATKRAKNKCQKKLLKNQE